MLGLVQRWAGGSRSLTGLCRFHRQTILLQDIVTKDRHQLTKKGRELVKDLKHQQRIAQLKFTQKKEDLIQDLKETKTKVKEKFEEVIVRENVYTVPNMLCVTRIAMCPYLGYMITQENYNVALGLLVFASATDLLDGWIARTWSSQSTKLGSFLDPMADKILIGTLFVSLTWQSLIPLPLTCLIIGRDIILVIAGFVIRYNSLPPPRTLSRYFDVSHVTAQLAPTFISKVNTFIQLLLVGSTLAAPVFNYVDHPALQALWGVTALSTIASTISYCVAENTYKYIKK